ncbi:MAG: aldehyde ferredoxin oxidoreductase family protein [Deltaproteobacteria bacterium]|nr:aldehyde ferredoxin oxidoreductase family protein [Deltaproteobacteria bacterium]
MAEKITRAGQILRINLSTQTKSVEPISPEILADYLGGRGLGAYYLYREVDPGIDAFSPDNKLIFINGSLVGSLIPGANKVNVTFQSPLTNTYSYALCGGHWGPELKFAGYDGIIVEGRAEKPVYIWIENENVEIRAADHLRGQFIKDADLAIKEDLNKKNHDDIQIALIGPAGEKLSRIACITVGGHREFGRGGAGAVMGSKNLKAIAIRGTQDLMVADTAGMQKLSERLCRALRAHPKGRIRREYGTVEMVEGINSRGYWSTRNFTQGFFKDGYKLEAQQMKDDIVVGSSSCYACPVACGKRSRVNSENYGEILLEGPEFETVGLIGANCGVSDWESIVKATEICDNYGMDTMSAGASVALAMECFERGIITTRHTGGIELLFGNGQALVKVLELMGRRKGIGDVLAEGVKIAAEKFGAPELAVHSKGMSFATYDPRGAKGMALTYATSPKGAHHMVATTMAQENTEGTRFETRGKGKMQHDHQISMCTVDSLGLCATMRIATPFADQAAAFELVRGISMDEANLKKAAERIINLERMYNVRLGLSRKDDTLPRRFLEEPLPDGESKGQTVDLEVMLDEFYASMGWNAAGIPTPEKLSELDLLRIVNGSGDES